MTTETQIILLTFILAIVNYYMPAVFAVLRSGITELAGSRDNIPPADTLVAQRAERANANFKETLPWAIGLLTLVQVTGDTNATTALGGWLYLICRALYLPIYLTGVPYLRSIAWAVSMVGLIMVAWQLM